MSERGESEITKRRRLESEQRRAADHQRAALAQQEAADAFYWRTGKCCAGCDHWEIIAFSGTYGGAGECTRNPLVPFDQRFRMAGFSTPTIRKAEHRKPGHPMTPPDHRCGEFADTFDWSSLDPVYLRRIGASTGD